MKIAFTRSGQRLSQEVAWFVAGAVVALWPPAIALMLDRLLGAPVPTFMVAVQVCVPVVALVLVWASERRRRVLLRTDPFAEGLLLGFFAGLSLVVSLLGG